MATKSPLPSPPFGASISAASGGGGAYRWYVLILLFCISIANFMDRTVVPALAEPLKAEFNLSDSQFGFLAGLVYAVSYSVFGIPIGLLIDRMNRSRLLACLVTVWGGATMLLGMVTSFPGLILGRMAVAGAESGGLPTSISLINDYFPPEKRASAVGILYASSGIASFLSFALAGWIGATYGWRTAFLCVGAPGVLLGVLALFTLREPKRGAYDPPASAAAEKPRQASLLQIVKAMILNRRLRYLAAASVLSALGVAGIGAFTASYFFRVHALTLAEAGLVTGLIMGGAYAVGAILGGVISDMMSKRSAGGGCYFVAAALVTAVPFAVAGFLASDLRASIALIFIFKVLVGAFYGATFAGIATAAPTAIRGAVTAYMTLLMSFVGYGVGPQLAGILSDIYKGAGYADPIKWSLATMSLVLLLSGIFYVLAGRSLKADDMER